MLGSVVRTLYQLLPALLVVLSEVMLVVCCYVWQLRAIVEQAASKEEANGCKTTGLARIR